MENASKALIMAAEVLIGIIILSIAVYLFNLFASYSEERYKEIESTQIVQFNNQFMKFYGTRINSEGIEIPIECTIHDITSLANLAQKHNLEYELQAEKGYDENTLYVQIDVDNKKNIEKYTNDKLVQLIKQNDLKTDDGSIETKYYRCIICDVNKKTGRVNYVKFQTIK